MTSSRPELQPELGQFQREFAGALLSRGAPANIAIAIHRNTTIKGLVDALAANYPTIVQLVEREWFDACAGDYVRLHPAACPALVLYGESFPMFLKDFGPAQAFPYLPEVARIDRLWIESHTARDAEPLPAASLAGLNAAALYERHIPLHPAARIGWFKHSAATIWIHHRSAALDSELAIEDSEEGLLLTRPAGKVEHQLLDHASYTFLATIREGATLGAATVAALQIDAQADVSIRFAQFITAGTF
jgi:Putative DNA-binding domain